MQHFPASDLVRVLVSRYGHCPVNARQVHGLILDGKIPADRGANGRFTIAQDHVGRIADVVGITAARTSIAA